MSKIIYQPQITVLLVENDQKITSEIVQALLERNIFVHSVDNLQEAKKILKEIKVNFLICDGMFPRKKGQEEKKSFIPLANHFKKLAEPPMLIAWSNSTHVHEYCRKNKIESYSKIMLTKERFRQRGRKYIQVKVITPDQLAENIEEKYLQSIQLQKKLGSTKLDNYYSEPATILAIFLAFDTRTKLFEETAGYNYGASISRINDKLFTVYIDKKYDAKISQAIYNKIINQR